MKTVAQRRRLAPCVLLLLVLGLTTGAAAEPTIEITSARFANLFELGDAPVLRITVTADAAKALRGSLEVIATDAYHGRAGRRRVPVDLAPGASVDVDLPIRSRRPLGHFSVSARVRNARKRTLVEAESTAAIVPPVEPSDAEDSAVGYFVFPDPTELPRAAEIAGQMRRLGIRWVRLTFNWWADRRIARPDMSDPAWLDTAIFERWVDAFRASGIEVLGVLFGTARWASSAPDDLGPVFGIPRYGIVKPRNLDDWLLFARTLSERLRGRIRTWEMWNEPDISAFWQSGADEFAALTRATADVLHDVDPGIRVGVNVVDRLSEQGLLFSGGLLASTADALDIFGLHYSADDLAIDLGRLALPLMRPGGGMWNTEAWGAPRRHISRWLSRRAAGVEKIFPFIYHTMLDDAQMEDFKRFGRYPVNVDYTPRPDAVALRTLADMVGSATPVAIDVAGLGYEVSTFEAADGAVVALADGNELGDTWSGPPGVTLTLSVPSDVRRVTVVDLMGNQEVLIAHRGRLRLRLLGVAAFLKVDPPASLTGLRVERARARRR